MSAQQIILILGAGPRIGAAVAASFAHKGYKIAIASRKGTNTKTIEQYLSLEADFADPSTIPALFNLTKEEFGSYPNVVVYNAPAMTPPPNKDSVLSISQDSVRSDLNVNTISPYVAAQEAVKAWETTLDGRKKSFIYTGNMLNKAIVPMPALLNLGIGKSASAFWIGVADASYKEKNYRFFYADERTVDGAMKGMSLDGDAHGKFYVTLADHEGDIPWQATFVKDKGYVKFN